jgi:DNA-binding Lrp family transcriptional regulator
MQELPEKVSEAFYRLKENSSFRIVLQKRNGHYYVYRATTWWDKQEKKVKSSQQYIGRITEYGAFIKRAEEYEKSELDRAIAVLEAHGIVVNFPGEQAVEAVEKQSAIQNIEEEISEVDKKILMCLSMNSRMPMSKLAGIVGISEQNAYYRVKALEKRFGIRYILEINTEKLGYSSYLFLIKFLESIPPIEELKKLFEDNYKIQFVAVTKGEYDIMAYMLDVSSTDVINILTELLLKTELGNYKARWNLIPYAMAYSFVPLMDNFIENALKSLVWKKNRNTLTIVQEKLRYREYLILKELNLDSSTNFSEIDKKYKLNEGTARYTYQNLLEDGIIVRSTITMTKLPMKYVGIIVIEDLHGKLIEETRHNFLRDTVSYGPIINKYCLGGNIAVPIGAIVLMPTFEDGYLEYTAKKIEEELRGSLVKTSIITDVIIGSLCYRRFDNSYSMQYKLLIRYKRLSPQKLLDYK